MQLVEALATAARSTRVPDWFCDSTRVRVHHDHYYSGILFCTRLGVEVDAVEMSWISGEDAAVNTDGSASAQTTTRY